MTDPATETAALVAAVVYLGKTVYELVIRAKNGNGNGSDRCRADRVEIISAAASTSASAAANATAAIQASMNIHTELLKEMRDSQQDTRDGVRELITIQRHK